MARRFLLFLVVVGLLPGASCTEQQTRTALVPDPSPWTTPRPAAAHLQASFKPVATPEAAIVDQVGQRILAANPQIGSSPMFLTIGRPEPEIFHRGTSEIIITEGLVKQCATEGQLAAVLCHELGKLIAEREVLAGLREVPERLPPQQMPVGNDGGGALGAPDRTSLAELAFHEKTRRRPGPLAPPDPAVLARGYLDRAGVPLSEIEAAAPLIQGASVNSAVEKQLIAPGPARPITR